MTEVHFTPAQQKALDLSTGKIVIAGAGSGKTTVLTERYIRLLETGTVHPGEIIAMTFTRKAASQLIAKVHIAILKRLEHEPQRREFWEQHRRRMSWARINTIHGICSSLLRAWPRQAEVDPGFVVEETGDKEMRDHVHEYIRSLAFRKDEHLAALLETLDRPTIEMILLLFVKDKDVWLTAKEASEHPEQTIQECNRLLQVLNNEDLQENNPDHHPFLHHLHHLVQLSESIVSKYRGPRRRIGFDDLELQALTLLRRNDEAVRIIRNKLKYLLVDEFQDTSNRQWEIIRLLAGDNQGNLLPDKLFLVGDAKQSIYGFRKANVTVLQQAKSKFASAYNVSEEQAVEQGIFVNLNDNFRSVEEIITPLNRAFERLLSSADGQYRLFEAKPQPLLFHRKTPDDCHCGISVALGPDQENETVLRWIAQRIRKEVQLGMRTPVSNTESRPVTWSDYAILLKTRTRISLLELALRNEKIPYQVVGGRGYFDRQEVRDMMHLIAALADSRDILALTAILRSPLFSLSDLAIALLFMNGSDPEATWRRLLQPDSTLREQFELLPELDRRALEFGFEFWNDLKRRAAHSSASEIILHVLEASGAWGAYATGQNGEQRIANLYRFVDVVRQFQAEGYYSLRKLSARLVEYADEIQDTGDEEADISSADAVKIMTIHGAKGLQFSTVVLADLDTPPRHSKGLRQGDLEIPEHPLKKIFIPEMASLGIVGDKDNICTIFDQMKYRLAKEEEEAEHKRLLYVAATRTQDRLLLVSSVKTKKGEVNPSKGGSLEKWMDAFELSVNMEEKVITAGIDDVECIYVEQPAESIQTISPVELLREEPVSHTILPDPLSAPHVLLTSAGRNERFVLPVTGFAEYLAEPSDDAIQRLLLFTESEPESPKRTSIEHGKQVLADMGLGQLEPHTGFLLSMGAEIGSFVHGVYQYEYPGCEWETVSMRFDKWTGKLSLENGQREILAQYLAQLFNHGRSMGIHKFPETALRELPILLRLDGFTLQGRIDLAWMDNRTATVIDYKTNLVSESELDETVRVSGYDHQARLYALALKKAWNLETVESRLLFLTPCAERSFTAVPADEHVYKAELVRIRERWMESR